MKSHAYITLAVTAAGLALAPVAFAQWSDDPNHNLVVADLTGYKNQPKIQATSDGGCYISWLDDGNDGWDVYLQRLDAQGYEQWVHNGLLVADRSLSSTEDYGLAVDVADNAVLAFRDDRGETPQITAARISPDGTFLWGPDGVQVSDSIDSVMGPRIAATSDGGCVVGWTGIDAADVATVELQKLDADGVPLWGPGISLADEEAGSFMLADLKPSDGGAIVSWISNPPGSPCPVHLWAQKFSCTGTALWGASHVIVFDGGTLQGGYFPTFVTDGHGGAVFGWQFAGCCSMNCAAQRILADGNKWLPHNGMTVSTAVRARSVPTVSFNSATEEIFIFWEERGLDPNNPGYAMCGQKLIADRGREWGAEGRALTVSNARGKTPIRSLLCGDGAMVFFNDEVSSEDGLCAARVDTNGDPVWSPPIALAGSQTAWRLDAALSVRGAALLAWTDGANVYAQNVNPDGTLGPIPGDLDGDGDVDLTDLAELLGAWGTCTGDPGYNPAADLDDDECVGLPDLAILLAHYGEGT